MAQVRVNSKQVQKNQNQNQNYDYIQEEMKIVNQIGLNKEDYDHLKEKFKKYGAFSVSNLEIEEILKSAGYTVNDKVRQKIIEEFKKQNVNKAEFVFVAEMAKYAYDLAEGEDSDSAILSKKTVDAFTSMGGGPGIDGAVLKSTIVEIIKNQFELTFEIEDLLDEITKESQLNFTNFCLLFEGKFDDSKSEQSRKSFVTAFSERFRPRTKTFHVRYKDFLKFCEKMDGKQNE